jgi:hypothetical protein
MVWIVYFKRHDYTISLLLPYRLIVGSYSGTREWMNELQSFCYQAQTICILLWCLPVVQSISFGGKWQPNINKPATGWPRAAIVTLIWCVRPVCNFISKRENVCVFTLQELNSLYSVILFLPASSVTVASLLTFNSVVSYNHFMVHFGMPRQQVFYYSFIAFWLPHDNCMIYFVHIVRLEPLLHFRVGLVGLAYYHESRSFLAS